MMHNIINVIFNYRYARMIPIFDGLIQNIPIIFPVSPFISILFCRRLVPAVWQICRWFFSLPWGGWQFLGQRCGQELTTPE